MHDEHDHHHDHHHEGFPHRPNFGFSGFVDSRRRGALRIWVFTILRQAPKNGADIMNQIELMSHGHWRPSPGSIYPLLEQLCKEESILKLEDGRYELTEKGKKEFEWPYRMQTRPPLTMEGTVEEMNSNISYLEDLKHMDPSKVTPNIDKLKNIRDRLTALIDTQ
jgi:DNA-binding PadR family transcriptional regulator